MAQGIREAKQEMRALVRAARREMPAAAQRLARDRLAARLAGLVADAGAARVSCYLPQPGEADPTAFISWAAEHGVEVLLPVSLPGHRLDWALAGDAGAGPAAAPGRHGILEPTGPRLGGDALASVDLALIPACAVDAAGVRLGWGLGYYDRALASLAAAAAPPPVFAIVHDAELVDALPREPHDVPIDGVVTPSRILRFP
ncbi:5-formyltetrahydrofolate cyclo-ligase [Leucobacter allii]|uniref:5-formyltetrahydrofolate cyclo-ligase n=1 Tax=Leucobacter allii TaxID=2932247 RepID=UPI001FD2AF9F|nr:5-formyltetrahydrofolate cyclo-ligase [Leucobacter allii]UOR00829.1 5-formyltetrahydrofolate cyclo-ligase [Leucobacter allii]